MTTTTSTKFIINKDVILESLQKVLGPATTKQNFPILNSVLISSENNKLKFTTTDLDITNITYQEANIIEDGCAAVSLKRFMAIIRELPSQDITIEIKKNNLSVKCEKIEFKMSTLDPQDFPKIESDKKSSLIKLNAATLEEMLRLTSFCVGYEDVNYVLSGILFEVFENTIKLVATDGKRLAFIERKLPQTQSEVKTKISFILPSKATNEIYKLIKDKQDDIFLLVEDNRIGFDFKDTQFFARPIEGEFPAYAQYIPDEGKNKLIVDRQKILFSLRRADLLSTPDYQGVKLGLKKDNLVISKVTPQLGEVREAMDVQYNGVPLEMGFNPQYLLAVLKNLDDTELSFEFFDVDKPAVLRKEGYVYLILPMKI